MGLEGDNMDSYPVQDPPMASAAFVLREINLIVRSMLPAEIAEPHLHVIGQGAEDLLNFIICTGNSISDRLPSLADLPIGHLLTISPERVASLCTQGDPCLCREEIARRVALLQDHAASLGYWPSPAAEAWNWLFHFSAEDCSLIRHALPFPVAIGVRLETEFANWLRCHRRDSKQY